MAAVADPGICRCKCECSVMQYSSTAAHTMSSTMTIQLNKHLSKRVIAKLHVHEGEFLAGVLDHTPFVFDVPNPSYPKGGLVGADCLTNKPTKHYGAQVH